MDNKITKKRFSDFMAYEWIMIIVAILVAIFAWELVYTMTAVKLTEGQKFKYYYDQNVIYKNDSAFSTMLKDKKTFSFDVLEIKYENINEANDVLFARLQNGDGDAIITNIVETDVNGYKKTRAKQIIDGYTVFSYDELYEAGVKYLNGFLTADGKIDKSKIEKSFRERIKGDNRFKTEESILKGLDQEVLRIEKLELELKDFKKVLEHDEIFIEYLKYEQIYNTTDQTSVYKKEYKDMMEKQTPKRYILDLSKLSGGEHSSSEYFKLSGKDDSVGTALLVFDFERYQPDHQFETISFVNAIIRACSNILG